MSLELHSPLSSGSRDTPRKPPSSYQFHSQCMRHGRVFSLKNNCLSGVTLPQLLAILWNNRSDIHWVRPLKSPLFPAESRPLLATLESS